MILAGNNSESSDTARRHILKLWSYESPLFKDVNRATQWQDKRAIKTLGPYALVLFCTLWCPPKTNKKKQTKMTTHIGSNDDKRVTLYRGLGLPEKAIQVYHAYRESGD